MRDTVYKIDFIQEIPHLFQFPQGLRRFSRVLRLGKTLGEAATILLSAGPTSSFIFLSLYL
jgi:hypothetical protein